MNKDFVLQNDGAYKHPPLPAVTMCLRLKRQMSYFCPKTIKLPFRDKFV